MLNNFINRYDFIYAAEKGFKVIPFIIKRLFKSDEEKVEEVWSKIGNPSNNWWNMPDVAERWNYLITGDKNTEYYQYTAEKYFSNRHDLTGYSIGCGGGHRELKWAAQGMFSKIYAVDISQQRIFDASNEAAAMGYEKIINYKVEDIYKAELKDNYYDVIFLEQILHHLPVKETLLRLSKSLKPDGIFVINEFVGPNRFQWTNRQLEIINGLLKILPAKYRKRLNGAGVKKKEFAPSRLRMLLNDPSEAIDSSNILSCLHELFEVVELKEYGGTILHLLFKQIAQNFLPDDENAKRWTRACFEIEDLLLDEKEIQSDFIFAVCKRK